MSFVQTKSPYAAGTLFGLLAYLLWGLLPLYFVLLAPAGPFEIVSARVLFSLVFCVILLSVMRLWREFRGALASRRTALWLLLASGLIAVNWFTYTWAVLSHHAIEAALGYFMNPLVSVLLGVVVLRERLRVLQWIAVGLGGVAIVVLGVAYGSVPWVALILAFSFGFYGYVKNRVGASTSAVTSLSVETLFLTPVAAAVMLVLGAQGQVTLFSEGAGHFWILAASGVVTAMPLILFGAAARRLPLSTIGLLQYLAPTLQFLIAVLVLGESMPPERWIGFSLVWVALIIFTVDMLRTSRKLQVRAAV